MNDYKFIFLLGFLLLGFRGSYVFTTMKINNLIKEKTTIITDTVSHIVLIPVKSEVLFKAKTIRSEARGESFKGMLAIGEVINNRMINRNSTIDSIIYSPGQFDGVQTKYFKEKPKDIEIYAAVLSYYSNILPSSLEYYANPKTSTDIKWISKLEKGSDYKMKIDNHIFYDYKKKNSE